MGTGLRLRPQKGVRVFSLLTFAIAECLFIGAALLGSSQAANAATAASSPYIVSDQAGTTSAVAAADVSAVGAAVVEPLNDADAVLAELTLAQVSQLQQIPTVTVTANESVSLASATSGSVAGSPGPAAVFPQQTGATNLWSQGDSGSGANVAVLDTGITPLPDFAGRLLPGVDLSGEGNPYLDSFGHGTFVAGLIAGNGASSNGLYMGEAPGAGLVSVKVAGATGQTDVATVIEGVGWVIAHHVSENIGVLNMSLGAIPTESTLLNPLDQAVQRAWQAGIVVVVSAGNDGPFNGTILSPGDDPSVITVGSLDDQGSLSSSGDTMSSFSAVGPTNPDGWIKPDLVTSGQSVVSLRAPGSTVDVQNPSARIGSGNFVGSGTSFSSAITSGAAALLLAHHNNEQPDSVKAALLGTTAPGPLGNPLVDGHGMLNVAAANAAGGLQLDQPSGQVSLTQGPIGGTTSISPGATIEAGYSVQMPGQHAMASLQLVGGELDVPVSCVSGGPLVGFLPIDEPSTLYTIAANSTKRIPAASSGIFQGSAGAADLCSGGLMYPTQPSVAQVTFTGSLVSSDIPGSLLSSEDISDPVQVRFAYGIGGQTSGVGPAVTVTPVAIAQIGDTVDLGTTWSDSAWNPSNWSGAHWSAGQWDSASWNETSWVASDWNGAAFTGSAWNGAHWSGTDWNGAHWSGDAWDGSHWSGTAWSGAHWSGAHWSGGSWGSDSDTTAASTAPASSASLASAGTAQNTNGGSGGNASTDGAGAVVQAGGQGGAV
jgi:serine protease AprX